MPKTQTPPCSTAATLTARNAPDYFVYQELLDRRARRASAVMRANAWEHDLEIPDHARFVERMLAHLRDQGWKLGCDYRHDGVIDTLYHAGDGSTLHVRSDLEDTTVCAYADSPERAESALISFGAFVTRWTQPRRRGSAVPARIWRVGSEGATSRMVRLECPRWSEIAENYPQAREGLDWLMKLARPAERGHVVLWHGPTGTGKTWAARALMREWRSMEVEIVSDPDAFLENPSLANELVLARRIDPGEKRHGRNRRCDGRLLIFEDAPELQQAEGGDFARTTLAKLLNATDGLLDQGVPTVVLATTHESSPPPGSALVRPGRCLQVQDFPRFDQRAANDWLAQHGSPERARGDRSLAELYAALRDDGVRTPPPRERVGFRVAVPGK